jgi:hypothetical protein
LILNIEMTMLTSTVKPTKNPSHKTLPQSLFNLRRQVKVSRSVNQRVTTELDSPMAMTANNFRKRLLSSLFFICAFCRCPEYCCKLVASGKSEVIVGSERKKKALLTGKFLLWRQRIFCKTPVGSII